MGNPVIINDDNKSGTFILKADDEGGVTFVNETGREISNLSIKAEGQWLGDTTSKYVGAEGDQTWSGDKSKLKYRSYVPFSLVGVNNGNPNDIRQLSQQSGVTLAAGQNLTILMNDIRPLA